MPATPLLYEDNIGVHTIPLSSLLQSIQGTLKNTFRDTYWIIAEVTNVSKSSAHYYYDLAEMRDGQLKAKCRANLWGFIAERILPYFKQVTGDYPKVGMELMLQVKVEFHLQYGFSLTIQNINPEHTLGDLERKKQETIQRLKAEGVFDLNKHYTLPLLVQRIAVISSETAAGWGDFYDQVRKSPISPLIYLELFPAVMQGNDTTRSIYQSMVDIQERLDEFDAVIILRGGGSRMDLSAFDDYHLCMLIANFPAPIITAIGHERDVSVADMVAHTSVKTPTAAAEFVLRRLEGEIMRTLAFEQRIETVLTEVMRQKEQEYTKLANQLSQSLQTYERRESQRLSSYSQQIVSLLSSARNAGTSAITPLSLKLTSLLQKVLTQAETNEQNNIRRTQQSLRQAKLKIQQNETIISHVGDKLKLRLERIVSEAERDLNRYEQLVSVYDPTNIMRRGFLPVLHNGKTITTTKGVESGDEIRVLLLDGEMTSLITSIQKNTKE